MKTFPDTSFLCAVYRKQDNSARALARWEQLDGPLTVSRLLIWEFRQAARFQAFRSSKVRNSGFSLHVAEKMVSDLADDMSNGFVTLIELDSIAILARGEQLSKSRTALFGHRGFDILHVATALELGATDFLTFDTNQAALAQSQGLASPLSI